MTGLVAMGIVVQLTVCPGSGAQYAQLRDHADNLALNGADAQICGEIGERMAEGVGRWITHGCYSPTR